MFEKGNGPLCSKRMTNPLKGTIYICMLNDNIREGIDVHIRMSAVTIKEKWGIRQVKKFTTRSWDEPFLKN